MNTLNDFSNNLNSLTCNNSILDQDKFLIYCQERGPERVKGYQDALCDILSSIDNIIYKPSDSDARTRFANTPNRIRTELKKFYEQQTQLFGTITEHLSSQNNSRPASAPYDSKVKP